MKIAQIPPLWESVPPKLYGGTERVVAHLCDALTELGHEVTLFGTCDAHTSARLVTVRDQSIRLDDAALKSDLAAHLTLLYEVRRRAQQFDILHFHIDLLHLVVFEEHVNKTVTTLHGRLDIKDLSSVYARWPAFGLVSVSDQQRKPLPGANWLSTVAHGVPLCRFPFSGQTNEGYLAFLGRISPEKRPDLAIRLARRAGIPLRIAAKIDAVDRAYFEATIRPLLDTPGVEYIGEIGDDRKAQFLGDALALLFPIDWPEPFGLVMIEAMACGTPVIAWNCGSVPEVVDPGVTGFIVSCEDDAVAAIARVGSLDRRRVRATFERRFTSAIMANAYLDVYSKLLNNNESPESDLISRASMALASP
jgi:glycosyltransferase involved in cell wall biosynthesis